LPFAVIDLRAGQNFVLPEHSETNASLRLPIAPYPGLNPFTANDESVFFARAFLIERILEAVNHSSFVALIGPARSGKTSLIQAGLIPNLNRKQPDQQWEIRFSWPTATRSGGRTLVVIDLRTLAASPEISIPDNVCILAEAETREQVLFCERKLHVIAERIEVTQLSESELMQAITEPPVRAGLHVAPELAQRVLDDIRSQKDQLFLLQYVMTQIYTAPPRGEFTLAKYESLGGIEMIERRCESICGPDDFDWLSRLVSVSEDGSITPQEVPEASLPERSRPKVDDLVSAGILVRDDTNLRFSNRIFVDRWTHLRDWVKENRTYLLWRQRLALNMMTWQANPLPFRLLSGEALAEAKHRVDEGRERLSDRELAYIDASEKRLLSAPASKDLTTSSRIVHYVAIPLVAVLLLSVVVWYFRSPPRRSTFYSARHPGPHSTM
jgi:hypothetical protein